MITSSAIRISPPVEGKTPYMAAPVFVKGQEEHLSVELHQKIARLPSIVVPSEHHPSPPVEQLHSIQRFGIGCAAPFSASTYQNRGNVWAVIQTLLAPSCTLLKLLCVNRYISI